MPWRRASRHSSRGPGGDSVAPCDRAVGARPSGGHADKHRMQPERARRRAFSSTNQVMVHRAAEGRCGVHGLRDFLSLESQGHKIIDALFGERRKSPG